MPLRILYLEDSELDVQLAEAALRRDLGTCEIRWAKNRTEFARMLLDPALDLVLSDYRLPTFDGASALKLCQAARPLLPFILVSGTIGEEQAVECLRQGATDYVLKANLARLPMVIRRALAESGEHAARIKADEERQALLEAASMAKVVPWKQEVAAGDWIFGDSITSVLGYSAVDFRRDPDLLASLIHPEDLQLFASACATTGPDQAASFDCRMRPSGDDWVWTRWSLARAGDSLKGVLQDVTERKRAEEAIAERERFIRATLDSLTANLAVLDATGTILATNASWRSWVQEKNLPWEGVTDGANYLEACHRRALAGDLEAGRMAQGVQSVLEQRREAWSCEWTRQASDEPQWFFCKVLPFPRNGHVRVVVVHEDVTGLRKAELALEQLNRDLELQVLDRTQALNEANDLLTAREQEIQSLVDHLFDCVITVDAKGTVRSANQTVFRVFGYQPGELVGRSISILIPGPHPGSPGENPKPFLQGDDPQTLGQGREIEGLHKDGRRLSLELSITKFMVRGETFFIGTLRDISDRRQIIAQLLEARKEAEQANQAKSAFLAAMSHEIRTPMNGVIGMIDVLSHSHLPPHLADGVKVIRDSAFSLMGIIDDILDFSKIEAGRLELERAPVRVPDLIEGVCDSLGPVAASKGVDLALFIDPAMPQEVWSDATRLRQLLNNLVGNAIKFSSGRPETRGRVTLRAEVPRTQSATLSFTISDNGIGMSRETLGRLFTPFTQAEVSTTRRYGGSGLGLVISRRIVDMMLGTLVVDSVPGKGSTFTVQLPMEVVEGSPAPAVQNLAGTNCILLPGPNLEASDIRAYLEHAGARLSVAQDLADAAHLARGMASPIVIHDLEASQVPVDEIHAAFAAAAEARHLHVARGRRNRPRITGPGTVTLDCCALRPRVFLRAIAVAAGLASPEVFHATEEPGPTEDREPPTVAEARAQGRLILVAEDDETNQKIILRQLGLLGFAAEIATDGRAALHMWREGGYAMLLTDLHMPEMDGYELTQAIRHEEQGSNRIPILALTANALRGEASRALAIGMNEYLVKPIQLHALKGALERWLPSAAAPPPPRPIFDVAVLETLIGKDPLIVREFLGDYLASAQRLAADLRSASEAGDISQMQALAHKFKSASRSVGAMELGALCAALEASQEGADAPLAPAEMARLETVFAETKAEIRRLLGGNL